MCSPRALHAYPSQSPVMDASVVFSLGETADVKRSGLADHMSVSGETAHKQLPSPPESPGVTRLRHRRLIAFLRDQGFHDSYNELTNKTRAHMSLRHLRGLVERGRWLDAVEYVDRYLPPPTSPKSFRAQVLRHFLVTHHRFANAVAGVVDKFVPRNYLQLNNGRAVSHAELRLRSICFSIFAVDEVRANMDWETVRGKASLVVSRLARSTPELRRCITLPATGIKPHHILPIASGSRKRYLKKKQTGRTKAIIRALKSQRLMVPEIGSVEEAQELLADLLDETIRAGVGLTTYGLNRPLQPGRNEGTIQHVVEAGCHANIACQDLDGKRKSRDESIIAKLERELQRHCLTGTFRVASPAVVSGPGAVVNLGDKLSGVSSQ